LLRLWTFLPDEWDTSGVYYDEPVRHVAWFTETSSLEKGEMNVSMLLIALEDLYQKGVLAERLNKRICPVEGKIPEEKRHIIFVDIMIESEM
jgi:hypothetical protein